MRSQRREPGESSRVTSPWLPRLLVLSALVLTLVIAGPRAWRAVAARIEAQAAGSAARSPLVATDRLGSIDGPPWLRGDLLRAFLTDLEPLLRGSVRIMDEPAARALRERLLTSAWVRSVSIDRAFPDRFRVHFDLRRPVARLIGSAAEGSHTLAVFDADGVPLPTRGVELPELPIVALEGAAPAFDRTTLEAGVASVDRRILAACAVAAEWRDELAPLLPEVPALRAIDPRNVDYGLVADPHYARVLVGLQRGTGGSGDQQRGREVDAGLAWFHHGVAQRHGGAVSPATRAEVLRQILAERPGLVGVDGGDLRLRNLWRNSLLLGDATPR